MTIRSNVLDKYKNSDLTGEPDYQELTKIGLTSMATDCYEVLIKQTFLSTKEIANRLDKPYRSVQRCLYNLQDKGFIRKVYTGYGPTKYEARLLYAAMAEYALWQQQQIEKLIEAQKKQQYETELEKMNRKTRRKI